MALRHISRFKGRLKHHQGFSLIEIILALALFAFILTGLFGAEWGIKDLFLNDARLITFLNMSHKNLFEGIGGNGGLVGKAETGPFAVTNFLFGWPFSRCESLAVSKALWRTGWQSTSTTEVSLLMADLGLARRYGGDCGGQPADFSDQGFDLIRTANLGGPATSVDIFKDIAYVSLKPGQISDPDIASVQLDGSEAPRFLNIGFGVNKVDAIDGYLLAALDSTTTQIAVFRTTDPLNPVLIATSTLPGVAGARPEAVSLAYFDNRVYVGTKRTAGREFQVFDVTNPSTPHNIGNREVNHNINDIAVNDGFAFLATSGNVKDLIILDIRDPTNIREAAALDLPGNEDGRSIFVAGNLIFLGRYKSTVPSRNELYVLKYETPENASTTVTVLGSAKTGADINAINFSGGYIFAVTNNPQKELQVFKFNEGGQIVPVGDRDLPAGATGLDSQDASFIVTSGNNLNIFK